MKRKLGISILTFAVIYICIWASTILIASAAQAPMPLYDFEKYPAGKSIEDVGIGVIIKQDNRVYPKQLIISDDATHSAEGKGQCMKVVNGTWTAGDDWQIIDINVPQGKQDWSKYSLFAFYLDNTACESGTLGMQIFFVDGDDETWGWSPVQKQAYAFQNYDKDEKPFMQWADTDWGGQGYGSWFKGYIVQKLDSKFYSRIVDPSGKGNNKFDIGSIKKITLRIGVGVMGCREDDQYFFDNFFLCNELAFNSSGKAIADGAVISDIFKNDATHSSSKAAASSKIAANVSSSKGAESSLTSQESSAIESSEATESFDADESSALNTSSKAIVSVDGGTGSGLVIGLVIAAVVVVIAGGGLVYYLFVLKKKGV